MSLGLNKKKMSVWVWLQKQFEYVRFLTSTLYQQKNRGSTKKEINWFFVFNFFQNKITTLEFGSCRNST